jgi:hypothetical protein
VLLLLDRATARLAITPPTHRHLRALEVPWPSPFPWLRGARAATRCTRRKAAAAATTIRALTAAIATTAAPASCVAGRAARFCLRPNPRRVVTRSRFTSAAIPCAHRLQELAEDARGCRLAAQHIPCEATAAAMRLFPKVAQDEGGASDGLRRRSGEAKEPPPVFSEGVPPCRRQARCGRRCPSG